MKLKLSQKLSSVLEYARHEAMRTGSYAICVDHLTLGMLRDGENDATSAFKALEINTEDLRKHIEAEILGEQSIPFEQQDKIAVSRGASAVINMAGMESLKDGSAEVGVKHLLLAISRTSGNATHAFFERVELRTQNILALFSGPAAAIGNTEKTYPAKMRRSPRVINITIDPQKICS